MANDDALAGVIEHPLALGSRLDQLAAVLIKELEGDIHLVPHLGQTLQADERSGRSHHALDAQVLGKIDLHPVWKFGDLPQQPLLMAARRLDGSSSHQIVHPGEVRGGLESRHRVPEHDDAAPGDEADLGHGHALVASNQLAREGEGCNRRPDLKPQGVGRAIVHAEERGGLFLLGRMAKDQASGLGHEREREPLNLRGHPIPGRDPVHVVKAEAGGEVGVPVGAGEHDQDPAIGGILEV